MCKDCVGHPQWRRLMGVFERARHAVWPSTECLETVRRIPYASPRAGVWRSLLWVAILTVVLFSHWVLQTPRNQLSEWTTQLSAHIYPWVRPQHQQTAPDPEHAGFVFLAQR